MISKKSSLTLFIFLLASFHICGGVYSVTSGDTHFASVDNADKYFKKIGDVYNESELHQQCKLDLQDRLQMKQSSMLQTVVSTTTGRPVVQNPQEALKNFDLDVVKTILTKHNITYTAYAAFLFLNDLLKVCMLQSFLDLAMRIEKLISQIIKQSEKRVVTQEFFDDTYNSTFLVIASLHPNSNFRMSFDAPSLQKKLTDASIVMQFTNVKRLVELHDSLFQTDGSENNSALSTEEEHFVVEKRLNRSLVQTYKIDYLFAREAVKKQAKEIKGDELTAKTRGTDNIVGLLSCAPLNVTLQSNGSEHDKTFLHQRAASLNLVQNYVGLEDAKKELIDDNNPLQERSESLEFTAYCYLANLLYLAPPQKTENSGTSIVKHSKWKISTPWFDSSHPINKYLVAKYFLSNLIAEIPSPLIPYCPLVLYSRTGDNQKQMPSTYQGVKEDKITNFVQIRPKTETEALLDQKFNKNWLSSEILPYAWKQIDRQLSKENTMVEAGNKTVKEEVEEGSLSPDAMISVTLCTWTTAYLYALFFDPLIKEYVKKHVINNPELDYEKYITNRYKSLILTLMPKQEVFNVDDELPADLKDFLGDEVNDFINWVKNLPQEYDN
jgi:hypothetical protein